MITVWYSYLEWIAAASVLGFTLLGLYAGVLRGPASVIQLLPPYQS